MSIDGLRPDETVNLKGKSHPLFRGVLRLAHAAGLISLEVSVLQYPSDANGQLAVCQAVAVFPGPEGRDRIFSEVGDCDMKNAGPMIVPHRVRMAATRAKGRALRDALGIGEALVEELGSLDDSQGSPERPVSASRGKDGPSAQKSPAARQRPSTAPGSAFCQECGVMLSADEIKGCEKRGWPLLCAEHGKAYKEAIDQAAAIDPFDSIPPAAD